MPTNIPETLSTPTRRSFSKSALYVLRLVAVNFLVFAVLAELLSIVVVHLPNWPSSRPNYHLNYNLFWAPINPVFGAWHRPNGVFVHKGGCYDVTYYTNSYGARDVERSVHSSKPRTIVLGDSMVEGMGVPTDERLSNILERDTGREHLNFATGGNFGPLQYALLYKSMAAAFDHNLVIVGVVPENDFHDMDLAYWKAHGWAGVYRPYYGPDLSIIYDGHFDPHYGESTWDHIEAFLRAYLASYHVGQFLETSFYYNRLNPYCGYDDYNDVDLARLKKSLEDIQATADARGAKVAVFLIPHASDFIRLRQTGVNRLGPVLEAWGREVGIAVKDLLPEMNADAGADYRRYFNRCDGHWSYGGNQEAAKILEPSLYGTPSAPGPLPAGSR